MNIECIIRAVLVTHSRAEEGRGSYRCFLALDGGAVEAEGRYVVRLALDVKDALVVPLSRLGLGEVLGSQRDRLGHPDGDVDLGRGQNLRTVLRDEKSEGSVKSEETQRSRKTSGRAMKRNTCLLMKREKKRKLAEGSDSVPGSLTHSA